MHVIYFTCWEVCTNISFVLNVKYFIFHMKCDITQIKRGPFLQLMLLYVREIFYYIVLKLVPYLGTPGVRFTSRKQYPVVRILDPLLVYDNINLGRRIDPVWPDLEWRAKGKQTYTGCTSQSTGLKYPRFF